jgi:alanine-synthesizing transaminase
MSMGNPDGATPPHIVEKLVDTVKRPDTHGYSASKGIPRLRRAIPSGTSAATTWLRSR